MARRYKYKFDLKSALDNFKCVNGEWRMYKNPLYPAYDSDFDNDAMHLVDYLNKQGISAELKAYNKWWMHYEKYVDARNAYFYDYAIIKIYSNEQMLKSIINNRK